MNSVADLIAVSTERPFYPQAKSRWYGRTAGRRLRLVFSFYSPDGNEVAMPLASMSAYLKRDFPWVDVILKPILILRDAEAYNPENYARSTIAAAERQEATLTERHASEMAAAREVGR
mgnify:CR=1 FL=1